MRKKGPVLETIIQRVTAAKGRYVYAVVDQWLHLIGFGYEYSEPAAIMKLRSIVEYAEKHSLGFGPPYRAFLIKIREIDVKKPIGMLEDFQFPLLGSDIHFSLFGFLRFLA
jgi:hypothetical protein